MGVILPKSLNYMKLTAGILSCGNGSPVALRIGRDTMAQVNPLVFSMGRLGLKALERLSKASVNVHGEENIPDGPVIFAVNHFTRMETHLLATEFYRLTGKPVLSMRTTVCLPGCSAHILRKWVQYPPKIRIATRLWFATYCQVITPG